MELGAGVYDDACTKARELTGAKHVVLVVIDGDKGSGFSVQSEDPMFPIRLPMLLIRMAEMLEEDLSKVHPVDKTVNNG